MKKTLSILITGIILLTLFSTFSAATADGIWPVCGRITYKGASVHGAYVQVSCEGKPSEPTTTGLFGFYSTTVIYKKSVQVTVTVDSNQYGTFKRTVDMDVNKEIPTLNTPFRYLLFIFSNCRVDLDEKDMYP